MAASETSFENYTLTYQWTVNDLYTRLYNPSELKSPEFSSPPGAKPATKYQQKSNIQGCRSVNKSLHKGLVKVSVANPRDRVIQFDKDIYTEEESSLATFTCDIKVWSLDEPVHVHKKPSGSLQLTNSVLEFNLGKHLEEARRNNLFTDVTIVVAERKEFKAHKVVLASQSDFFKTRFTTRWVGPLGMGRSDDRVEMTDVPSFVMEAILSYMYTGKVVDIEKVALHILSAAEEYGLVGLRKMCEQALAKTLTVENAVDVLVHANANNAQDLKKVCMDYIATNAASIRKSDGWQKLKGNPGHHDLWVEMLETITEIRFNV